MANTRTETRPKPPQQPYKEASDSAGAIRPLSDVLQERAITGDQWRTMDSLFPGATQASKLMVFDYCRARKLDPMKKPCHIVPMRVKTGKDPQGHAIYEWRDIVMPGIYELRTTAHRTGLYMGHSEPEYGDPVTFKGKSGEDIEVPRWIKMVFYRWNEAAKTRVEFPVRRYFREIATFTEIDVDGEKVAVLNDKWTESPVQMGEKSLEAAGLRETFPDEIGGQHTFEEMAGRVIDSVAAEVTPEQTRGKPHADAPTPKDSKRPTWNEVPVELIAKKIDLIGLPLTEFLAHFELGAIDELPLKFVNDAMDYLEDLQRKQEPPNA